jgi:hypothetical protein
MLAKCTNPTCSAEFRYLREGKLFQLEVEPTGGTFDTKEAEYFWLCSRCSAAMTLRLAEDGTVVAAILPQPTRSVSDDVSLIFVDRKNGMLLRTTRFVLPENFGDRVRARLRDGHHVG